MKPFRYCPNCQHGLTTGVPAGHDEPQRFCLRCGFVHYTTSYPTASALIVQNGRLLLTQRARDPFAGDWELPGGFLNAGEHPQAGVVREMREELGIEIAVDKLLGIFMDVYGQSKQTLNIYYLCEIKSGEPAPISEIAQFDWFAAETLPTNIAFHCNRAALARWLATRHAL